MKNADQIIAQIIDERAPALVGRLGGTEGRFIGEYLKMKRYEKFGIPIKYSSKLNYRWKKRKKEVRLNAGFSASSWSDIDRFVEIYKEGLGNTDVLGAWGTAFAWAESLAFTGSNNPTVIPIGHTAPWVDPTNPSISPEPWSTHLNGKNVLVIAGFAESIKTQHHLLPQIFPSGSCPNFKLRLITAPLSAGRNPTFQDNWFENLYSMEKEMDLIDFDIALISAGAYSYPLALKAKQLGKIGIHTGGGLQLFFGIMGGRWDQDAKILAKQNEFWIRPSEKETPENAKGVEGGCYW
jgi:hypothetical protein